ncbi:MAG: hypothetical protein ACYCYK_01090 [Candidatus Dormibacteria bacterium]
MTVLLAALCLGISVHQAGSTPALPARLASASAPASPAPTAQSAPVSTPAAGSTSQQCGGITDPFCYVMDAFVSGPVAIMGSLDGSPDPAHINPVDGSVTSGPWSLITTLVGSNPVVDNYDGSLGEPAHECGSSGCIPWVQKLNSILTPITLGLIVIAFVLQVSLFMAGQELNMRAGIVPCLVAAAVIGAGLPLHLAGRTIDAGSWLSQGLLQATFQGLGAHTAQPLDMMTVLAMTAYCPEDSPISHPGIHISAPGTSPAQAVLVKPWMDPHFTQSHCIGTDSPDFTKEVLNRSENFFGPPLHDANCDRGDASPGQPLCTNTDNQVNNNQNQNCLEGSGSPGLSSQQLNLLPLPGEPHAGNGQSPADCRYADIYWGTVPTFTDVWNGVGPHGRNGYDVPDGIQGMLAFTVLTLLGLWLAMTYLARYLVLALLAGCSSLAFLLLAFPGGRGLFNRYWRTVAELSTVVVVQTLIFIAFVAVISTVSGLAPVNPTASCPLISAANRANCSAGAHGLLAQVGSGNPGDQFAKCLLAIVTVWLMLEVPKRISRTEMSTYHSLRGLASASSGVLVGGALMARSEIGPRTARFGATLGPAVRGATFRRAAGTPSPADHELATSLERSEVVGQPKWPTVRGHESREQFIGRSLVGRPDAAQELGRVLKMKPQDLEAVGRDQGSTSGQTRLRQLGADYVNAHGALVHDLDAAYLNSLRRGRLAPLTAPPTDQSQ